MKSELTIREIRNLLKSFRKLGRLADSAPPKKKDSLWEGVKSQAKARLIEELKSREKGFTLRPHGPNKVSRGLSEDEEKLQQDKITRVIEARAEKEYRTQDPSYNLKLERRETSAKKLVANIDHTITALKVDIALLQTADQTLLLADWKELTSTVSLKNMMKHFEQGGLDRTIDVLKIIKRRLMAQRYRRVYCALGACLLQLYEKTVGAIVAAILEGLRRSHQG